MGPLIPLFWISGKFSPGFQSQDVSVRGLFASNGFLRITSGVTPAALSTAVIAIEPCFSWALMGLKPEIKCVAHLTVWAIPARLFYLSFYPQIMVLTRLPFLLPPANKGCEGYVFTPVCQSFCSQGGLRGWGACMVARGGMCGCWGACVVAGGCVWLLGGMHGCRGVCMVAGGHAWLLGGMCGCWEVSVVAWGHAWLWGVGGMRGIRQDTVNERAVRILLECILVLFYIYFITICNVVAAR